MKTNTSKNKRESRHKRIRAKVKGTSEMPRLCVFRSNKYIYAQIIDDSKSVTLCSISNPDASVAGKELAKLALAKNIKSVVFDRGGYFYTGKIKAIADGARAGGLQF